MVQSLKVKVKTQKKQLEILHSIFERYKLEDGIHLDELFPMLKMLGLKLSRDELEHLMEQLGATGESHVRPDTFLLILLDQFFCIKDQKVSLLLFKFFLLYDSLSDCQFSEHSRNGNCFFDNTFLIPGLLIKNNATQITYETCVLRCSLSIDL